MSFSSFDDLEATMAPVHPGHDRIVVIGGASNTLDLLRLATVRSDDVLLVSALADATTRRFVERFAVEWRERQPIETDLAGASAVIAAAGDMNVENRVVQAARRRNVPIHVPNRPLISDFTLIELLERRPSTFAEGYPQARRAS